MFARPVFKIAEPIIKSPIIIITIGFEKSAKASFGVKTFVNTKAIKTYIATISDFIFPLTKQPTAVMRIIIVVYIGDMELKKDMIFSLVKNKKY
ncbi:MAG: hypothetical protein BWY78_00865 [Alphaproteobacteria bacterium ADurb.Bin438]|nr:MAG: hypothetical protein BWY78_00865 [Alphaproteobacteria bacterium ADurb.Bin438]